MKSYGHILIVTGKYNMRKAERKERESVNTFLIEMEVF